MKKRYFKGSIVALLLILSLAVTACGANNNVENNNENNEENMQNENNHMDSEDENEEVEEIEAEEAEDDSTGVATEDEMEVEAGPYEGATFLLGDLGVYIASVDTFIENEELGLPYAEGSGYMLVTGSVTNNGDEVSSLNLIGYVERLDDLGDQAGNATSWLEDGVRSEDQIEAGQTVEFKELFMYDTTASTLTITYKSDDYENYAFYVDVTEASSAANAEDAAETAEMLEILETTSDAILEMIANHEYEGIVDYAYYTFVAANLDMEASDAKWFESYNWEEASAYEEVMPFGTDYNGNEINMTYNEFFDTYINAFDFASSDVEIKQERIPYYSNTADSMMTHYVKYTDGEKVIYFIYEETYFNEFALSGIGLGIE